MLASWTAPLPPRPWGWPVLFLCLFSLGCASPSMSLPTLPGERAKIYIFILLTTCELILFCIIKIATINWIFIVCGILC